MQKCTSSWHGGIGRRNGLKIHRWKHTIRVRVSLPVLAIWDTYSLSKNDEVGTKMLNFCILHSCVMQAARMTYGITPNIGYLHFTKMVWLLVQLEEHLLQERVTGSSPVQSTRRRKHLIFCECTLMADVTSKWS